MNWAIAVTCFALLAILRKRTKPKILWVVNVALALFGGAAFFATTFGGWIAGLFGGLLGWVGGLFASGASAGQLAGVLVLIGVVVAVLDIGVDRRADKAAITALITLPMLVLISGGPLSDAVQQLYGSAGAAGQASIGALIGGG